MLKLKKNDEVQITAGKDKGKKGRIERVYVDAGRVLLPGLNLFKRHMKKQDEQHPGGIISMPRPVPIGNVALICPKCGKMARVGFVIKGKNKMRQCKRCKTTI
jgi:large subunit ribosomal protein L24